MMRKLFILVFVSCNLMAQNTIHNFGSLQLHNNITLGFHTDFINDGSLQQNSGLAGFYAYDRALTVSGAYSPLFYDVEILVEDNLFLQTSIEVENNANFIVGNVVTPREQPNISLIFREDAFYNGVQNATKIDGSVAVLNKNSFVFPVGDDNRLRPLELNSEEAHPFARSAYFYENPNSPISIVEAFDTDERAESLTGISHNEFWVLEGTSASTIKLTWDTQSQMSQLANAPSSIRVVGWHTTENIWQDLGSTSFTGTLEEGSITSETFVPSEYSAITFGTTENNDGTASADHILVTPNGDGANDFFDLDVVQDSPNNHLSIYNRWGKLVYSKENYSNTFDGVSNVNYVVAKDNKLPDGLYFYIIKLSDLDTVHQGYLYINR